MSHMDPPPCSRCTESSFLPPPFVPVVILFQFCYHSTQLFAYSALGYIYYAVSRWLVGIKILKNSFPPLYCFCGESASGMFACPIIMFHDLPLLSMNVHRLYALAIYPNHLLVLLYKSTQYASDWKK